MAAELGGDWQRRSAERDFYQPLLASHLHAAHFGPPPDDSVYASPCHALGAQS